MAEEVVGSAYVIIRAITERIKKDIQDGVKKGANDSRADNEKSGEKIGDQVGGTAGRRVSDRITRGLEDGVRRNAGRHRRVGAGIRDDIDEGLGGGGGSSGPGFIRRFMSRVGNIFRKDKSGNEFGKGIGGKIMGGLTKGISAIPIKPFLFAMILPALGGLLHLIGAYVASAVSLLASMGPAIAGAGIAYAGVISSAGVAMGALKLAFSKTLGAGKQLDDFKLSLSGAKEGLHQVALTIQRNMFPSLSKSINKLARNYLPILNQGLGETGTVVGALSKRFASVMTTPFMKGQFAQVLRNSNSTIGDLGLGVTGLVKALVILLAHAKPVTDVFGHFVRRMGIFAGNAAEAGAKTGKLDAFMRRAAASMHTWGTILGNFGKGLFNIFRLAVPAGNQLTTGIGDLSEKFLNFTKATEGKNKISAFFNNALPVVHAFNHLIGDVFRALGRPLTGAGGNDGLLKFIDILDQKVLPAIIKVSQGLGQNGGGLLALFGQLADVFATLAASGAFGTFISTLGLFLNVLQQLLALPFVPQLIGMALAFGGVAKAVDLVLKPFGGLKAITGPLGKALFGTGEQAGLMSGPLGHLKSALEAGIEKMKESLFHSNLLSRGWTKLKNAAIASVGGIKRAAVAMGAWIKQAVLATIAAAKQAAVWIAQKVAMVASAIATGVMTAAQWLLNAAMSANPITLIVIALVALVAIFVLAWKNSETFRNIVTGAFHAVLDAASAVWHWIKKNWPLLLAILTGPFGLVVLAISGHWRSIKNGAANVVSWITDKFDGLIHFFTGLPGRLANAVSKLWDGLVNGFKDAINFVIRGWNSLDFGIHVHLPWWLGGYGIDIDDVIPDIPYLAKGGRATRPTLAMIGEGREPESVLPDSVLGGLLDRAGAANAAGNNGELSTLISMIAQLLGHPIVLKVDGKTIARATIGGGKQLARTS